VQLGRLSVSALLLLCAGIMQPVSARNVALLVAVGQFKDPQLKTAQLLGPPRDVESMQKALTEHWGFLPGDIVTLRDQDATRDRILDQIAALEKRSAPGDTVFIYFSGHGTSTADHDNQFDLPYATGAWVPYDLDYSSMTAAKSTLIVGRTDLVPRLKRLDQAGRWVVVVSDSCYSGQVVRSFGQSVSHSRYLPLNFRDLGVAAASHAVTARLDPPPYPYQHVLLISGASDSETGADISTAQALQQAPTLDGQYHGAFSDAFLRLLNGQLLSGSYNYAQAREALNSFLENHKFAQHPQLLPGIAEDPQDIGSRPFLAMATVAPSAPAASPAAAPAAPPTTAPAAPHVAAPAAPPAAAPGPKPTLHLQLESVSAPLRTKITALSGVDIVNQQADMGVRQHGDLVDLLGPAGDPIVQAKPAKDPQLLRRIAAQAWLNRVLPPAGDNALGLRAETDPGSRGNTFVQCETFVFTVRLKKPAYLMVLDLNSEGNLNELYPVDASERQVIAAGALRMIPGTDPGSRIRVTTPFGSDQVAVVAFEHLPAFFADLNGDELFGADSPRADKLAKGLAAVTGKVSVQQITVHTYRATGKVSCSS